MNELTYDFAIAGSSALAALVALALAKKHGARVCLIGKLPAPLQISRDIALSPAPFSRPETMHLLAGATAELRGFVGADLVARRSVQFAARSATGRAAAAHARHMLESFGTVTALMPRTEGMAGFVAEGIWSLDARRLFGLLPARLAEAGVAVFETIEDLTPGKDMVRFAIADGFVTADRLVVTDASCEKCLGALPNGVATSWRTALRTESLPRLAGTMLVDVESGGFLVGRADGRVDAVAPSEAESDAGKWLGAFLPPGRPAEVIARLRSPVLLSADGAPLIAPLPRKAATLTIGFGAAGSFFALPLARYLANDMYRAEAQWFAARGAGNTRLPVAEIGRVAGGTA